MRPAIFDRVLVAIELMLILSVFVIVTHFILSEELFKDYENFIIYRKFIISAVLSVAILMALMSYLILSIITEGSVNKPRLVFLDQVSTISSKFGDKSQKFRDLRLCTWRGRVWELGQAAKLHHVCS